MQRHKYNIFPPMNDDEYAILKADISKNGYDQDQPVIVYDGAILDGWNRYRAACELGVPYAERDFDGTPVQAIEYVMRTNKRRNLTSSQWACIAVEADEIVTEIKRAAKERQIANLRKGEDFPVMEKIPEREKETSSQTIANIFNTNEKYVRDAERLKAEKPEVFERVKSGEKNLAEVKKEEKKQKLEQKKAEYIERVQSASDTGGSVDIYNADKKYRVIYADPCWSYNDKQEIPNLGGATKHYKTMTIAELCALPVPAITEDDAVLFLWVTSPLLEECFDVIRAWGFKYKTSFVWDKIKHNMGHYNSVRHELLLVCTKGSCTPDKKKLYDSVQSIERNDNHSEKPDEFTDIIDTLYSHGDRIELFARKARRKNWHYWGNEI